MSYGYGPFRSGGCTLTQEEVRVAVEGSITYFLIHRSPVLPLRSDTEEGAEPHLDGFRPSPSPSLLENLTYSRVAKLQSDQTQHNSNNGGFFIGLFETLERP